MGINVHIRPYSEFELFGEEDKLGKKHQGSRKPRVQQVIEVNNPRPAHIHNSQQHKLIELLE